GANRELEVKLQLRRLDALDVAEARAVVRRDHRGGDLGRRAGHDGGEVLRRERVAADGRGDRGGPGGGEGGVDGDVRRRVRLHGPGGPGAELEAGQDQAGDRDNRDDEESGTTGSSRHAEWPGHGLSLASAPFPA